MKRSIEGEDRSQVTLLPECLDDYIGEDNPVRVVDAFVDELDLGELGFDGAVADLTGRPDAYSKPQSYAAGSGVKVQNCRSITKVEHSLNDRDSIPKNYTQSLLLQRINRRARS